MKEKNKGKINNTSNIIKFKDFIVKNKFPILLATLFSFVCFGFMLTNHTLTIDEDRWINGNGSLLHWIGQGRFGIAFLDMFISRNGSYVPFLWDFLAVFLWNFAGVIFLYLFIQLTENYSSFSVFVFCAYFSSIPFIAGEILSYSMFNLQISLALMATGFSAYFTMKYFVSAGNKNILFAILLLFLAVSIYQAFLNVYVTVIAVYIIFRLNQKYSYKKLRTEIIKSFLIFIFTVILYYIVNSLCIRMFHTASDYLSSSYLGWKQSDFIHALLKSLLNMFGRTFGIKVYGGWVIGCCTILFLIFFVAQQIINFKSFKSLLISLLSVCFLIFAPFTIYIGLGTDNTQGRMLIALCLSGAAELFIVLNLIKDRQIIYALVSGMVCFSLFYNAKYMNSMFYESFISYQMDRTVANQIMHDIGTLDMDYTKKPIVFVGTYNNTSLPESVSGSTGGSFFRWDAGSNFRITNFIKSEGYNIDQPTSNEIQHAVSVISKMKNWPSKNGILELNDCIVVRLSNPGDNWYITNGVQKDDKEK